ncbi:hypothetical protein A8F94_09755 [Bacillus sp. FJAT-27225]|uniref:GNAT family N-acetyltransferase n=1 Tax=Bacillus sp. FJAT-27225 TaxID=1743144 RepID=UPI00080C2BA5|nr:GNAT family N-acetyltransferase [Bacillus sp. FJAT-27225]OCA88094.1 hypothetical protein A8F94_09755 [Bacillus sp. FJAT-27225]
MITISKAATDDVETILTIGNEATLALHRKGINQWEYPWPMEMVQGAAQTGEAYLLLKDGFPAGSFFLGKIDELGEVPIRKASLYLSKIAVLPKFQGEGLGMHIIEWVWSFSKKAGSPMYLDCWAGNEKLKQFYLAAGLEYIGDFSEEDYFISVFKGE